MSTTIDERALFEALRAKGHDVVLHGGEDGDQGCCSWVDSPYAVLAGYRMPVPVLLANGEDAGTAHSIADVVRLLAPYRPAQAVAESVAVTVAESAPDFLDEMIAEGGAGYAERVDAAQARRDADAGDDDFAWGIDLFDEDPMGDAIEARGVALVAEAKAAVDAGRYREPRRVASAKDDADVLARAFEARAPYSHIDLWENKIDKLRRERDNCKAEWEDAGNLLGEIVTALGLPSPSSDVEILAEIARLRAYVSTCVDAVVTSRPVAVFDHEVPGMGRVVGKPLDHVRGAVRVVDRWVTITDSPIEGWNDGRGQHDGVEVDGVFVKLKNSKARFEPGTTAEDFARRYGAAMGGER